MASVTSGQRALCLRYSKAWSRAIGINKKKTPLEKIEDIELLRALEIGLKIKTLDLIGDSFSVDVMEDFIKAKEKFKTDKILRKYS